MYNGSHAAPRKGRNSKKPLLLLLSLVLVVALAVGGTLAWLTAQTDPVVNTFTAGTGGTNIEEEVTETEKKSVIVENKGNVDMYVRVKFVINRIDEQGNVLGSADVTPQLTSDWQLFNDGCYYYKGILGAGKQTQNILDASITLKDQDGNLYEVNVMAQTIQVGGGAVEDAWGMTYAGGTWTAAQG